MNESFATESRGAMLDRLYLMADGGISRDPDEGREFATPEQARALFREGLADGRIPKGYFLIVGKA